MAGLVLLEREHELAELAQAAREAAAGEGGLVLVSGEAGIGKSSLVRAVRGLLPAEARLLVGHCDDLGTPRPRGPSRDLVGSVGTGLTRALREGGERDAVLTALRSELDWAGHPTVLVVEDVHWADEATLDVLWYLARRVADLPAVLMLTYRDDELTREHPLQPLLGQSCTNAEIADRLVVSTRTVDSHVAAVLAKLGVTTRRAGAARPGTWASSTRKYRSRERRLR